MSGRCSSSGGMALISGRAWAWGGCALRNGEACCSRCCGQLRRSSQVFRFWCLDGPGTNAASCPAAAAGSWVYIEFVRGAPLNTLLFLGQNILGFMLAAAAWHRIGSRAAWVLTFLAAGALRGWKRWRAGLASVPAGQQDGARSLGLTVPRPYSRWCCPRPCVSPCRPRWGRSSPVSGTPRLLSLSACSNCSGTARTVWPNRLPGASPASEVYLTLAGAV